MSDPSQIAYQTFAVVTAATACYLYFRPGKATLWPIVVLGLLVRLAIAWFGYGNYDGHSWEIAASIADKGGNIYAGTERYQYTPIWFWVLASLGRLHHFIPAVRFVTLVRSFLTLVDLATLGVLLKIAKNKNLPAVPVALFFFLNPVSFLLTGYHGQFENLAILFLLLGANLSLRNDVRRGDLRLWLFSTLAMLAKHSLFPETLAALRSKNGLAKTLGLFALSCVAFAALFVPYWGTGKEGIIHHVFLYSSYALDWGVSTYFRASWLKWLFVAALFVYPLALKESDLVKRLLLCALFFLVFTTGFGNQYLILPIALGALMPSRGFFVYTAAATLFLLGDQKNLGIPYFSWMPLNVVWCAAVYWFVSIHPKPSKAASLASF